MDWNELIGDQLPGRTAADRERRQLRRAGRAPARRRPGLRPRRHGHAGDRHRRRHRDRRARPGRRGGLRRRDRPHGGRPGRPARAPAGAAAAGSASPRAPGSACWPGRRPWPGGWARWSGCAGGDPESVRGEDVSAAAAAGDPAAHRSSRRSGGGSASAWPTWPPCSTRSASCSAAAWSRRATSSSTSARATFADLVEGGDRRPRPDRARRVRRAGRRGGRQRWRVRQGGSGLMRTGVVLPTFRDTPDAAFAAAAAAVAAGVDGLFCYDHIWPIGQPERPGAGALSPSSARWRPCSARRRVRAAGRSSARWWPGSAWSPTRCWPRSSSRWQRLAPGRVIAGLGTGDRLSEEENRAYGIPFASGGRAPGRAWSSWGAQLAGAGLPVWVAGGPAGADRRGPGRRCRAHRVGRRARRSWPSGRAVPTAWR